MSQDLYAAQSASILVAARPTWRRNSLRVVLRTIPGIGGIGQAESTTMLLKRISEDVTDLVLLDPSVIGDQIVSTMNQIKALSPSTGCIAIVQTWDQQREADQAGADAVLLDGFRTEALAETIGHLSTRARLVKTTKK